MSDLPSIHVTRLRVRDADSTIVAFMHRTATKKTHYTSSAQKIIDSILAYFIVKKNISGIATAACREIPDLDTG
jgi:hypothetical protein